MIKRYQIHFAVLALVMAGTLVFWQFLNSQASTNNSQAISNYHQSQYDEGYVGLIDSMIAAREGNIAAMPREAWGGVVPHHLPTALPMIVDFYLKLKKTQEVGTFIIIGPDHLDHCRSEICVSEAIFDMPFGQVSPSLGIIEELKKSGYIVHHEFPFYHEHSMEAQILMISRLFPKAKIVPVIFRSSLYADQAVELGKVIGPLMAKSEKTFLIASIDFSHYLPQGQARPIDQLSAGALGQENSKINDLVKADSTQALSAFKATMEELKAIAPEKFEIFNTADFEANDSSTTGYISGLWSK